MLILAELTQRHAGAGRVKWLGLRPAKRVAMDAVRQAEVTTDGLAGDRGRAGKRAITLFQAEHLPVIAALAGCGDVTPNLLRRNVVVAGINLTALKGRIVQVGTAQLRWTTICAPCSRMEAALGHGGYNALRGHGGWCAEVIAPGHIALGDPVDIVAEAAA